MGPVHPVPSWTYLCLFYTVYLYPVRCIKRFPFTYFQSFYPKSVLKCLSSPPKSPIFITLPRFLCSTSVSSYFNTFITFWLYLNLVLVISFSTLYSYYLFLFDLKLVLVINLLLFIYLQFFLLRFKFISVNILLSLTSFSVLVRLCPLFSRSLLIASSTRIINSPPPFIWALSTSMSPRSTPYTYNATTIIKSHF